MIASPSPDGRLAFAGALLKAATEVEAAEARIKRAALDAAESGDLPRVLDILRRWHTEPPAEVVAHLGLAP